MSLRAWIVPGVAVAGLSVAAVAPSRLAPTALALSARVSAPSQQAVIPLPRGYVAFRTTTAVRMDGLLDDDSWQVPWTDAFVDIEGRLKERPRLDTRVKMIWDADYFYVAAELREPHVWATLTAHDSVIFQDPDFEVFIDPNGDNHEYYEFEMNALGTTWDLFLPKPYKDDGRPLNNWEIPGLLKAIHIDGTINNPVDTDRGWSIELAFPWRALAEQARRPAPPTEGDQWRVNFSRVEWPIDTRTGRYEKPKGAREDNWVWSPQHVVDMHRPDRWGYVQFTTRLPDRVSFVADPSWPAREWLHRVYYAQREYRRVNNRWAATLGDLAAGPMPAGLQNPSMTVSDSLFEVSVVVAGSSRCEIRQDSLIRCEPT